MNWARRSDCNVCKHPKFSKVEARTGFGGGYRDREDVEYKEREESDDEFDDVYNLYLNLTYTLYIHCVYLYQ